MLIEGITANKVTKLINIILDIIYVLYVGIRQETASSQSMTAYNWKLHNCLIQKQKGQGAQPE